MIRSWEYYEHHTWLVEGFPLLLAAIIWVISRALRKRHRSVSVLTGGLSIGFVLGAIIGAIYDKVGGFDVDEIERWFDDWFMKRKIIIAMCCLFTLIISVFLSAEEPKPKKLSELSEEP